MMFFKQGKPVWPVGLENEKNLEVRFLAEFQWLEAESIELRVTGSTVYRVMLNGRFVHHGPARGPHGFFRVDELDLSTQAKSGINVLTI